MVLTRKGAAPSGARASPTMPHDAVPAERVSTRTPSNDLWRLTSLAYRSLTPPESGRLSRPARSLASTLVARWGTMAASRPSPTVSDLVVGSHEFAPERHYRYLGLDPAPLAAQRATESLRRSDDLLTTAAGGDRTAALGLRSHGFETEVLGVATYRATTPFVDPRADRYQACADAYRSALDRIRTTGGGLIIARIDSSDIAALAGAQEAGFRVYDAGTVWMTRRQPDLSVVPPDETVVRVLDRSELASVDRASTDEIVDQAGRRFRSSHFHTDPRIPVERADRLYREWAEGTLRGGWSDIVVTVWRADEIVGFLGFSAHQIDGVDEPVTIMTDSFGMTREDAGRGVGTAMFRTATRELRAEVIEFGTQLRSDLVPMFARSGIFTAVGSYYTLHGWTE